jgi:DNA-binding ferritin-like protein
MPHDGAAIPAGLKRILADCFFLGFIVRAMLWRTDRDGPDRCGSALERLIASLDDTARETAVRIRVLGEVPPNSIGELLTLSARGPPETGEAWDGWAEISYAALQVARDFGALGVIARESGDEATAHFLFARLGEIEETVWSIGRLSASTPHLKSHQGERRT